MDQTGRRRRHTRAPSPRSRVHRGGGPGGKPAHGQPSPGRRGAGPGDLPDRQRPSGPPLRGELRPLATRGRGAASYLKMDSSTADRRLTPREEDEEGLGRKEDPGDGRHPTAARCTSPSAPDSLYPALCISAAVRRKASRCEGGALDRDHGHPPFHAAPSSERSDPTEAGGYACRPEMIDAPRPLDGLVPGFRAPARLFSEETDQGQERHDKTGGGGEQVNIAMPKAAIPNVVLPCRDLTVSYNRPYSASLGSQRAVREDS